MAAVWQGVARGRRSHQMLTEEAGSPSPGRRKPQSGSLCTRLSRRLPLGVLDANFGNGPSWEPLESSERVGVAAGSARRALGSVAQKIQRSCQSSGRRRDPGRAPAGSPHPSRRRRSTRPSGAPSPSCGARRLPATPPSQGSGLRRLSKWITKDPLRPLRRRSQRAAALLSPYSSPAPLCPTRGGCQEEEEEEEMESVAAGIEQLKHLSEAFDEAIATDERKQAVAHYRLLMAHNLRAMRQSEAPLGIWTEAGQGTGRLCDPLRRRVTGCPRGISSLDAHS
ncbi:LOW QUALITY PROTEIN: protein PIMREG [Sarcophilus harrisii]|uniref:LOW QUALITY PROTEIN: protein PIMREG n=1 Tax=Sarcophilus harrisii TaxID=9305 RepID=UPI001301D578|nr:LOW QUALITY PROTEIN: protein PIMREG [Sarcophilus harrisii]